MARSWKRFKTEKKEYLAWSSLLEEVLTSAINFVGSQLVSSRTNTSITSWLIDTAERTEIVIFGAFIDICKMRHVNTKWKCQIIYYWDRVIWQKVPYQHIVESSGLGRSLWDMCTGKSPRYWCSCHYHRHRPLNTRLHLNKERLLAAVTKSAF